MLLWWMVNRFLSLKASCGWLFGNRLHEDAGRTSLIWRWRGEPIILCYDDSNCKVRCENFQNKEALNIMPTDLWLFLSLICWIELIIHIFFTALRHCHHLPPKVSFLEDVINGRLDQHATARHFHNRGKIWKVYCERLEKEREILVY